MTMDNDEEFKHREHSHISDKLSQEDAALLEQLGHHGIGDLLNRDKEADISLAHAIHINPNYQEFTTPHATLPAGASKLQSSFVHPLAVLFSALTILLGCGVGFQWSISKPIDRQPPLVRNWPSVTGTAVNTVVHKGRHFTYDYTFLYNVADKSYWFEKNGLETNFHLSEVKYDPAEPSHYFRVPLEGEMIVSAIISFIGIIIGLSFAYDAILNIRNEGRPVNVALTIFTVFVTTVFAVCEFALYFNPNKGPGFSVASTSNPLKPK
jgi:hypothetical protein